MTTPTIAITHGAAATDAATRFEWLAHDLDGVVHSDTVESFSIASVERIVAHVGQGDPLLLIHFLEVDSDDSRVKATASTSAIAHEIRSAYLGIDLRQWAIILTGRTLDAVEMSAITELSDQMRGVVVTAASTNESVAHTPEEEFAFAADAAATLASSRLESEIGQRGGAWMWSAASITYSVRRLLLADAAAQAMVALDELLANAKTDVAYELGTQWIDDLQLSDDESWQKLLDSPSGGSLLAKLRLFDIDFDSIPIQSWSETLTTRYDLATLNEVPFINSRIAYTRDERFSDLRFLIATEILAQIEATKNVSEAAAYCSGMRSALDRAIASIKSNQLDSPIADFTTDRQKLRQLLRWLPFASAVATRVAMVALWILVGLSAAVGTGTIPVDVTVSRWPGFASTAVILIGWSLYRRRLRRTIQLRDRLARRMEQQLVDSTEAKAVTEHLTLLSWLRDWVGEAHGDYEDSPPPNADSVADWLGWLKALLKHARSTFQDRSDLRRFDAVTTSRFAIDVPTADDVPTAALFEATRPIDVAAATRGLIAVVRENLLSSDLTLSAKRQLVEQWSSQLVEPRAARWETLGEALAEGGQTLETALGVLATDLTPAGGSTASIAHYLVAPDEGTANLLIPEEGDVATGVMPQLTDTRRTHAAGFAATVHLYRLSPDREPTP